MREEIVKKEFERMMKKRLQQIEKEVIAENSSIRELTKRSTGLQERIRRHLPDSEKSLVSELSMLEAERGYVIEEIVYRHGFYEGMEEGSVDKLISHLISQEMEEYERTIGKLVKGVGSRFDLTELLEKWTEGDRDKMNTMIEDINRDRTVDELLAVMAYEDSRKLRQILSAMARKCRSGDS
jgi:hypothetical protein